MLEYMYCHFEALYLGSNLGIDNFSMLIWQVSGHALECSGIVYAGLIKLTYRTNGLLSVDAYIENGL